MSKSVSVNGKFICHLNWLEPQVMKELMAKYPNVHGIPAYVGTIDGVERVWPEPTLGVTISDDES